MKILGISSFYHDSAAALLVDGTLVSAIEEERFSRIKHDNAFPRRAIDFCLRDAGLSMADIDAVAYYEKPLLKFERLTETFVTTYPRSLSPFLSAIPEWIGQKLNVDGHIRKLGFGGPIHYVPHHLSHAAAAYYTSPFSRAAAVTVDGVGEYQTTGIWNASNGRITPLARIDFPHSLGLLYSTFTAFLGFKVNEDEYKVMGLSAYGTPRYADLVRQLIDIRDDGSFRLDLRYFSFREAFRMYSDAFIGLFGPPRAPRSPVERTHRDIAASIQLVTEEALMNMYRHAYTLTGTRNLCLSGGVALNALANGKIYARTRFANVHIFGAAGDSGAAVGAALLIHRTTAPKIHTRIVRTLYTGSSWNTEQMKALLNAYPSLGVRHMENESELLAAVAKLIARGYVVGWFWGRSEFGPRALGARSILSRAAPRNMKDRMNRIKRRESFRPFAGSVLREHVHEYFETPVKRYDAPFMNVCVTVREDKRRGLAAIVHADNTCRIQTVCAENGRYYRLIREYFRQTGTACILNTSFNVMGEPIVEHPRQAIEDFLRTDMDYLVLEDLIVSKLAPKGNA